MFYHCASHGMSPVGELNESSGGVGRFQMREASAGKGGNLQDMLTYAGRSWSVW